MTLFNKALLILTTLVVITFYNQTHAGEKTVTYYHTDVLGSVVAASNEEGEVIWRKTYDPYGNEVLERPDGQKVEQQTYTGKPYDAETGLIYLGQRYYDPQIRRFMGIDPVGFDINNPTSFNRYNYANNNPYKYIDPDGRSPELIFISDPQFHCENIVSLQIGVDGSTRAGTLACNDFNSREAAFEIIGFGIGAGLGKLFAGTAKVTSKTTPITKKQRPKQTQITNSNVTSIKSLQNLPDNAILTRNQITGLSNNINRLLSTSLPKATDPKTVLKVFQNDKRFRFIDQVQGARAKITEAFAKKGLKF